MVEVWAKTGRTILFVTHSVDEATFLGDEVHVFGARPASIWQVSIANRSAAATRYHGAAFSRDRTPPSPAIDTGMETMREVPGARSTTRRWPRLPSCCSSGSWLSACN